MNGGMTDRGQAFSPPTTDSFSKPYRVLKVGVGLVDAHISSLFSRYSSVIDCASDLDSLYLLGALGHVDDGTFYDILHISGCELPEVDELGYPLLENPWKLSTFQECQLPDIRQAMEETGIQTRLVILDSPPLAESDDVYNKFLEECRIAAMVCYANFNPKIRDRHYFLPRFLEAVLKHRPIYSAVHKNPSLEAVNLALYPKVLFNKKLLGSDDSTHQKVSLKYPA